jgi:hypothetical protein
VKLLRSGARHTFTTVAVTPPVVRSGSVSNITKNSAAIAGTVDTWGLADELRV